MYIITYQLIYVKASFSHKCSMLVFMLLGCVSFPSNSFIIMYTSLLLSNNACLITAWKLVEQMTNLLFTILPKEEAVTRSWCSLIHSSDNHQLDHQSPHWFLVFHWQINEFSQGVYYAIRIIYPDQCQVPLLNCHKRNLVSWLLKNHNVFQACFYISS